MKIAIVVHGRFHAFDMARALIAHGHHVELFTNYPGRIVERFGISRRQAHSFGRHGLLSRLFLKTRQWHRRAYPEAFLHTLFGRWAAERLRRQEWDVIHFWSGIGEELLQSPTPAGTLRLMMRGSAHIRVQSRLLQEEEQRCGVKLDRPSDWMIRREEREYALVEKISVLSSFAYQSFREQGVAAEKVCILPLGAQHSHFRPAADVVEQRCRRILAGEPLRLIYVGAISLQKGMWDMVRILEQLDRRRFPCRMVGSVAPEIMPLYDRLQRRATLIPHQPQHLLYQQYAEGDIFLFPSIQDGFAVVLSQALAAGLPIIATRNCAGPDLVQEDRTGWIVPIRHPQAFVERLHWCDAHRAELAEMVQRIYNTYHVRDWDDVAVDFERLCVAPALLP
jgi:glycosyltransferase involved in cell wall biosynthesis